MLDIAVLYNESNASLARPSGEASVAHGFPVPWDTRFSCCDCSHIEHICKAKWRQKSEELLASAFISLFEAGDRGSEKEKEGLSSSDKTN